ncbi:hypothetical protein HB852_05730 [Listeria grandensis]|uniref:hypothetical protein n=1 Tax=Listeria grandensis TaxID=1494963 RepID=UPI001624A061|nr:hypothetical protein [Listeria grandensis]MBC1474107.1 hypothetical protein [Listeria grandensis]
MKFKKIIGALVLSGVVVLAPTAQVTEAAQQGYVENFHYQNYFGLGQKPYWGPNYGTTSKLLTVKTGYTKTGYTKKEIAAIGPLSYKYRFTANYKVW